MHARVRICAVVFGVWLHDVVMNTFSADSVATWASRNARMRRCYTYDV
jgi:hypothetical protein